jgi:hypothetical protein
MTDSVSHLRAEVIEGAINLEAMINATICQHYFKHVRIDFVSEFLYDEYCSFALKRRVLLKICPELSDVEQRLNRMGSIRNIFAHVGMSLTDGPDPNGPARVPSPKDFSKSVDFQALGAEFKELEEAVLGRVFEVFQQRGGSAIKHAT